MSELAIGIMSGTSLDGIDIALVRVVDQSRVELMGFTSQPYDAADRSRIRDAIAGADAATLAELDMMLGERFAGAAQRLLNDHAVDPADVFVAGSHGQTIWHVPGKASLQLGNASVLAEQLGVAVVSDFRSADIAAGGQGAPLVPMADTMLFTDDAPRVLLNIGGMANVTWVKQQGALDDVVAFDTGPGVAIIDAATRVVEPSATFDVDGARAAAGTAVKEVVATLLELSYFAQSPPKSTGREMFGDEFAKDLAARVRAAGGSADDIVATTVSLVARSIAAQMTRWLTPDGADVVVSGGGARNPTLCRALREALDTRALRAFDDMFFDGDAKEAVAFAYLGWRTMKGLPGNVPAATGARAPRVLGQLTRVR